MLIEVLPLRPSARGRLAVVTMGIAFATLLLSTGPIAAETPYRVARLMTADPIANQSLGLSVAVDGNRLAATRLVTNASNQTRVEVLIYERVAYLGDWQLMHTFEVGQLANLLPAPLDLHGDRLAVGILNEPTQGTGIGTVVIHERDAGGPGLWGQVARLNSPTPLDRFGYALDLESDLLVVGAPAGETVDPGAAYIYHHEGGGTWNEVARLTSGATTLDQFGINVALSGTTVLVTRAAFGITTGSIFESDNQGKWPFVAELDVSDPIGAWGPGGSLDGERAVLQIFSPSTGQESGIAVFERDAGGTDQWGRTSTTFLPPTVAPTVSLLVGESIYASAEFNEMGLRLDRNATDPSQWLVAADFGPPVGEPLNGFGHALSVDDGTIVVGAPQTGGNNGAVYVFVETRFNDGFETGDTSAWTTTVP